MSASYFLDDVRYARMIDSVIEQQAVWGDILFAVQDVRETLLRNPEERVVKVQMKNKEVREWFWKQGFIIEGQCVVFVRDS